MDVVINHIPTKSGDKMGKKYNANIGVHFTTEKRLLQLKGNKTMNDVIVMLLDFWEENHKESVKYLTDLEKAKMFLESCLDENNLGDGKTFDMRFSEKFDSLEDSVKKLVVDLK